MLVADETLGLTLFFLAIRFPTAWKIDSHWPPLGVSSNKVALLKGVSEDPGGKPSWHNHKQREFSVVNATVGTIRKVNCAITCSRLIVGLFRNKVLSSMVVRNQIVLKIDLVHRRKNGRNFLDS